MRRRLGAGGGVELAAFCHLLTPRGNEPLHLLLERLAAGLPSPSLSDGAMGFPTLL